MNTIKSFIKKEAVLMISLILALISTFFVKPSAEYLSYIDFRTLALLFCLMLVMAGFNYLGIFKAAAESMLKRSKNLRELSLVLCLLCFFSSMIITNDVALITFVPFTILTLKLVGKQGSLIYLIALETIAANLGSMLTPIGNPQNLYLFSTFQMSAGDFICTILPYALLSCVLIVCAVFYVKKEAILPHAAAEMSSAAQDASTQTKSSGSTQHETYFSNMNGLQNAKLVIMYALLFPSALLTVFRVLPYEITLALTLVCAVLFDRKNLLRVDYSLLLTFTFLFIFIGNLGNIQSINDFLCRIVDGNEIFAGILASQVFSNVPAAILLSGFTANASDLLIGVNLGGLGTLIASMASLISYKFIINDNIKSGKYLLTFTVLNAIFLAANLTLWVIIR